MENVPLVQRILLGQFEAALCMLTAAVRKCPPPHWDGLVGKYPFWMVAYHTLCYADLYLTKSEDAFEMRDLHPKGWYEFEEEYPSRRFEQAELTHYADIILDKARRTIPAETSASLEGPSGFKRLAFSRAELHIYNLRHVQHHAGQLSAFLRRVEPERFQNLDSLRWAKSGWRDDA